MIGNLSSDREGKLARLVGPKGPFALETRIVDGQALRFFASPPDTLIDVIHRARMFGARPMVVWGRRSYAYSDILEKVDRLADHMHFVRGVRPGDVVAVAMPNCPGWIVALLAVARIGACSLLVPADAGASELAATCRPVLTLASRLELDALGEILVVAPDGSLTVGAPAVQASRKGAFVQPSLSPDDAALIAFSSGSTGAPKGIQISQIGLLSGLRTMMLCAAATDRPSPMRPGLPSTLVLSPFSHISGYAQPLLAMLTAGRIVLPTSDDLGEIADLIEAHEVRSIVGASATVLGGLAALAVTRPFHSLGTIGTHGGKEADQAARALSRVLPQACVSITYGMTETSGAIAMRLAGADDAALDRIGFVVPNIDLKIVDPAGEEVQPGISGRILVRGPMLMQGYIHPGEGLERRSPGAWFDTGDIGAFDLGGELSVLGRAVDRGGGDIDEAVAGIEEALRRHPGVLEVIALRSPRPTATRDDMVVALVPSPIGGEPPFADWLRREAGWNAQAPRFVELNSMPRLHSGKIDRRGLRDALFR